MASAAQGETASGRRAVKVHERYKNYEPPFEARAVTLRLLDAVPPDYLLRLDSVVLTNHKALSHDRRRATTKSRKRKVKVSDVRGLYHQEWNGQPAWIEVFVDKIVDGTGKEWLYKIPVVRDLLMADVVYHELGHHVHKTRRPEFREREDVADDWCGRFTGKYFRSRYGYLLPLVWVASSLITLGMRVGFLPKPARG